jgi:hypothetical protein
VAERTRKIEVWALIVAIISALIGYAAWDDSDHHWLFPSHSNRPAATLPTVLPAGFPGDWHGQIYALGEDFHLTLGLDPTAPDPDVGSLTVSSSWGTCNAGLLWESGNGPIMLGYDKNSSTGACYTVSFIAIASLALQGNSLLYTIQMGTLSDHTYLYH